MVSTSIQSQVKFSTSQSGQHLNFFKCNRSLCLKKIMFGTPCGVHLFDLLLWPVFQSSITHYNYNFFKFLLILLPKLGHDVQLWSFRLRGVSMPIVVTMISWGYHMPVSALQSKFQQLLEFKKILTFQSKLCIILTKIKITRIQVFFCGKLSGKTTLT